jgi:hypothetical protein
MDTISFEIGEREDPANGLVDAVDVFVNCSNLVDKIFLSSPRLLGEPTTYYGRDPYDGKIAALGCVCGDPGCWPFRG